METIVLVAVILVIATLSILAAYYFTRLKLERKFRQWQEAETLRWQEDIAKASKTAIAQSRAVLGGKFTEQMAPYLPEFKYDPTEARFIGSPIDFIIFPGLSQGNPQEIIIVEIKSGKNCQLTPAESKIRQLIEDGMVRWELIQRKVT
ncbi:Holliday junction resolvase-like protein [Chloroflexota bacterium]